MRCSWRRRLLGLLVVLVGCSPDLQQSVLPDDRGLAVDQTAGRVGSKPNIILISVDTLRADHLGLYGYGRKTSPRLDELANEMVRFDRAYAPAPWTLPSHAAMLTGVHPFDLGIDSQWRTLPIEVPTLAASLAGQGYQTAAFVDSAPDGFVGAERGFSRGFDRYDHGPHGNSKRQRFDITATLDEALRWLDDRSTEEPFFLFLHTKSVHALSAADTCRDARCLPYDQPSPHRLRFGDSATAEFRWVSPDRKKVAQAYLWTLNEQIVEGTLDPRSYPRDRLDVLLDAYDNGIRWVDGEIGRFYDELSQRGRLADTVLVVTSDHGESFLENDLFMHQELQEETLRVPLLVRMPGLETRGRDALVSEALVTLEDIAPTLLSIAGAPVPEIITGELLPLEAENGRAGRSREFFSYYLFPGRFAYQAFGIQSGGHRLVLDNLDPENEGYRSRLLSLFDGSWLQDSRSEDEIETSLRRGLLRRARSAPLLQGHEIRESASEEESFLRAVGYVE